MANVSSPCIALLITALQTEKTTEREVEDEEEEEDKDEDKPEVEDVTEKEKKTRKIKEVTHDWQQLNKQRPIWMRKPEEVTEEEYNGAWRVAPITGIERRSCLN